MTFRLGQVLPESIERLAAVEVTSFECYLCASPCPGPPAYCLSASVGVALSDLTSANITALSAQALPGGPVWQPLSPSVASGGPASCSSHIRKHYL